MTLDALNAMDGGAAGRELLRCCGSTRWAEQMAAARPFPTFDAAVETADRIWWALDEADWREAFAAHPRIGARGAGGAGGARPAGTGEWSAQEQSRVADARVEVVDRLAAANRDYEARFGYIFIICATGKSAADMLEALERRLGNAPDRELRIAAGEQGNITRLRLAKLVEAAGATAALDGRMDRP